MDGSIFALVEERRRVLVMQRAGWGKSAVHFVATALRIAASDPATGKADAQTAGVGRGGSGRPGPDGHLAHVRCSPGRLSGRMP